MTNVFNIYRYQNIRPHITYRFNCDIWEDSSDNAASIEKSEFLTFTIKSISQPVFKLDLENRKCFGNTQYVIPILKYGETELNITFQETDEMDVYKFLCGLYYNNPYFAPSMKLVHIVIREYDSTMQNVVSNKHYVAKLKSFNMPDFNNNSLGEPVDIQASFYVMYIYSDESEVPNLYRDTPNTLHNELEKQLPETEFNNHIDLRAVEEKTFIETQNQQIKEQFNRDASKREKRAAEIESEIQDIKEREAKAVKLILNINENSEELRKKDISDATRKFASEIQENFSDNKKSVEQAQEFFNNLSADEKETFIIKYAYGIDTSDGVDTFELDELKQYAEMKNLSVEDMAQVENTIADIEEANKTIARLEKKKADLSIPGKVTFSDKPTTKDFIVEESEIDAIIQKMHNKGINNVSKEDLMAIQTENAMRMEIAYGKFNELMESKGYKTTVNAYNDPEHEIGLGTKSGSHLLGQKVDITIFDDKKTKLTPKNMTKQQVKEIAELAKEAGLTPNWETSDQDWSGWGDFALMYAKSINKKGEIEDIETKTWTGEHSAKDTSTGEIKEIGKN